MKIQVILGSTRPGRNGEAVAKWVVEELSSRSGATYELVDVHDYKLPLFDEPVPPLMSQGQNPHTKEWAKKIGEADGYIFITAEYNRSVSGALKNAIDYLNHEWRDKAVGIVSYGSMGGVRAAEHLSQIAVEVNMAVVREQLALFLGRDFEGYSVFKPTEQHASQLAGVADQVERWSKALKTLR